MENADNESVSRIKMADYSAVVRWERYSYCIFKTKPLYEKHQIYSEDV